MVIGREIVSRVLDMGHLIDRLAPAMAGLSAGDVATAPRGIVGVADRQAILAGMPVYVAASKTLAAKLVTVFPHNSELGIESHHAVILVFSATDGRPLALLDGTHITAARTAAGSALATRLLAREDARVAAIVGTGVQARFHALALVHVRRLDEIRLCGRDGAKVRALAARLADEVPVPLRACGSVEAALDGADIVCATTHAQAPVLRHRWLAPGCHVNSVGVNPDGCELDADTVAAARVYVESREAALAPAPSGANDLLWPIRDGRITADHILGEIGEVIAGSRPGRVAPEDLTLYKSVGVAVQDAVAAKMVLDAAAAQNLGAQITL